MPNWNQLLNELKASGSTQDVLRRKYLAELHGLTGRNTILYYSGWLQKQQPGNPHYRVHDADKTGFMTVVHGLDRSLGLDLFLHTPGGDLAAAESLINYLRSL